MAATTVKLDEELLRDIAIVKPREQTLSAFVREALRSEIRRQQMRDAAEKYQALLRDNAAEREEMEGWERASLATVPTRKRK